MTDHPKPWRGFLYHAHSVRTVFEEDINEGRESNCWCIPDGAELDDGMIERACRSLSEGEWDKLCGWEKNDGRFHMRAALTAALRKPGIGEVK